MGPIHTERHVHVHAAKRPRLPSPSGASAFARAEADRERIRGALRPAPSALLQRKCACSAGAAECTQCEENPLALQRKLEIGEPGDVYEQEADRIAERVLTSPAQGNLRPRVQRARIAQRAPDKKKGKAEPKAAPCDQERIQPAIEHAQQLARRAVLALKRDIPLTFEMRAIKAHFGSIDRDQTAKIIERYTHVIDHLAGKTFTCPERARKVRSGDKVVDLCGEASCPGNEIHLFPDFGKEICPAGPVLLHEALHNTGACDDIEQGARGYPPAAPENNPYSYEHFALALSGGEKEPELGKRKPKAPPIQRAADGGAEPASAHSVQRAVRMSGEPLESGLRHDMEQRFGSDFAHVRVHTDTAAAESAREVNAKAYTLGHDIVFASGRFQPESQDGRRLLAHELTHVLQQTGPAPLEDDGPAVAPARARGRIQRAPDCSIAQSLLLYEGKPGQERCVTEDDPEFRKNYIDNHIHLATGLTSAGTTWGNIDESRVPILMLTYKDGRKLLFNVADIPLPATKAPARYPSRMAGMVQNRYEMRNDGFIYPIGLYDRGVRYDRAPNIVSLRAGIQDSVAELQDLLLLIELGVTFGGLISMLGGIGSLNRSAARGGLFQPTGLRSRGRTPKVPIDLTPAPNAPKAQTPSTNPPPPPKPPVKAPVRLPAKPPANDNAPPLTDIERARQKRVNKQVVTQPLAATGTDNAQPVKIIKVGGGSTGAGGAVATAGSQTSGTSVSTQRVGQSTVVVTVGQKSTRITLTEKTGNNEKLRGLGLSKEQAREVLQELRSDQNLPQPKTLISFAQDKGDVRKFLSTRLRDPAGYWSSDAFDKPPKEGIRVAARDPGENSPKSLRLSSYALVFEEDFPGQFTPKQSKTAVGVQEYQPLKPSGERGATLSTRPRAVVRVDEKGTIVEIVDHVIDGPPDKARTYLLDLFKRLGWKVAL